MKIALLSFMLAIGLHSHHLLADSKITRYQDKIGAVCGQDQVNNLMLKKSLIELVKGEDCEGRFVTLLLNKCPKLNCEQILNIYKNIEQVRSGSVVGD